MNPQGAVHGGQGIVYLELQRSIFFVWRKCCRIIVIGAPYPNLWILFMIQGGGLNPHGHLIQPTELAVNLGNHWIFSMLKSNLWPLIWWYFYWFPHWKMDSCYPIFSILSICHQWIGSREIYRNTPWSSWDDPWFPVDFPKRITSCGDAEGSKDR